MRRTTFLSALFLLLPLALSADRLVLRDGTIIDGRFVGGTDHRIFFQDDQGMRREFDIDRIQSVDFRNEGAANRFDNGNPYNNDSDYRPYAGQPGNLYAVVPAGQEIFVRTDEAIYAGGPDGGQIPTGRTFRATISRDVLDDQGNVVIPRGSGARLIVRNITPGGTVTGPQLVLDLDSVRVNGQKYVVRAAAQNVGNRGIGENRRTGEYVGGGAALGALVGALAGGGAGAAVGAAAGGVGGGALQVFTKGSEIRVPAEAELHFRLERPLQLNEWQ